jgi:hypothetical protein
MAGAVILPLQLQGICERFLMRTDKVCEILQLRVSDGVEGRMEGDRGGDKDSERTFMKI